MSRKLVFIFLMQFVFFQISCGPHTYIKIHDSSTVYGVNVLGESKVFTRGKIVSARDVQIEWQEQKRDTAGNEMQEKLEVRSFATEFVVEPDAGETFLFVQFNEEILKEGERVLILKENNKIRIIRDRRIQEDSN
jgi:outer membrane lipoprotein SlyB